MPTPLAVLIVEDMESDAQIIVRLLKKADYELAYEQVETAVQMRAALEKQAWDIVISDYKMPQFDGNAALQLLQDMGHDIPFIVVSGTIGEETAVSMMKAGAHDYLIKGDFARLVPAVKRELKQAKMRWERRQTEKALAASEAELRALFASMQDVVLVIDRQGVYRKVAPTNLRLLAVPPAELLGKNLREVFPAEQAEAFIGTIQQVLATQQTTRIEYEVPINGQPMWFEASISSMDADNTLWVAHDFTARKQAEEALAASEAELRALVEQVPAIVYTESAETQQTLYISPQVEKLIGYTSAKWVEDHDLWKKIIHPADVDAIVEVNENTRLTRDPFCVEYRILTCDGRTLWIHDEAVMIKNQEGTPLFWQGVMYDITERKQSEEQLRKLSRAVDQNPSSIVITDLLGNIEYVNPKFSQVTGYSFGESFGKNPRILKSGYTTREEYKKLWDTITSGNVWQGEFLNKTKNGETYWEFATIAPVFSEDGKITNFMALKENITERKRAELELQHRKEDLELINMLNDVINRGESLEVLIDTLNNETKRIYSATACTISLLSPNGEIITIQRNTISPIIVEKIEQLIGQPIPKIHVRVSEGGYIHRVLQNEEGTITSDPKLIQQWIAEFAENIIMSPVLRVFAQKIVPQIYKILNIGSTLAIPLTQGTRVIGLFELAGRNLFTEDILQRVRNISRQVTSAILRKQAEEGIHQRVIELEMLYQSGLALSQLLNPKEIGQRILELLEEKLNWRNTRIRLYRPQDDSLELLDFNQPGLKNEVERREIVGRFQTLITHSNQGMSGWVVQHGQLVRSGDVSNDLRYVEANPGIHSGLYVPMKLGERVVGVLSIEDEQPDAFSEADERLIATLANQAASAFENARLFAETRQRVMELETLNRISLTLRSVSKQNDMLSIVLDEALAILNTSHGSIELHNKATNRLEKTITRGWTAKVTEPSRKIGEGIAGKVFTSGEIIISHEYASDPETYAASRSQIPPKWGGICLPIRTTQHTLGVLCVSVPSEREFNKDDIRLLSILSEMTGAALQRMQLHEQTIRRLEQLNALRAVDQAISSSRDMHLTLNVLLTHTLSQLSVDAADVLLLHPGSNLLELVAGQGFHTPLLESASLSNSIAGRAIMEHHSIMALDFETASQNLQFGKLWKEEGFVCYWCVPLIVKGEVKGVLEVYCRTAFTPDTEWLEFLEALAGQAAIAIDSTQLFENLQRANLDLNLAYDATIEGWSRAMDLRDHETEGHTLRVTDLTMKLARAMRISESQLTAIRRGALLHDIGKMGVPDSILLKESDLTDEEWVLMRKHPQLAHDMLAPIAYLHDALNIPYCHHEKWDGTGYPQGLKGDHIPLVARIFAIVDVWDALTNDRTYRKRWTKQKVRQFINEQSGKHFDPQVVDVFLKHVEKS